MYRSAFTLATHVRRQNLRAPGVDYIYYVQPHNFLIGNEGKVVPYSLPSVGPGADPGVQTVSPQVT